MARELDLQTKICQSAKRDGGYGKKISHKFAVGIPDLLVALPPFAPCLIEVKDMGAIATAKFDRLIGITPKQQLELSRFSEPYEKAQSEYTPDRRTGMVLVGLVHQGEHRLVALRRDEDRLSDGYQADPARWTKRQVGGYYDLGPLLEWTGIVKMRLW